MVQHKRKVESAEIKHVWLWNLIRAINSGIVRSVSYELD